MCNRATPIEMMKYKLAFCLFKVYNKDFDSIEFVNLNLNQVQTGCQFCYKIFETNTTRVGLNAFAHCFYLLNDQSPFTWLNMSIDSVKVHCKKLFLLCESV